MQTMDNEKEPKGFIYIDQHPAMSLAFYVRMLLQSISAKVEAIHKPQEITLPNGEWGLNCVICDGLEYPCETINVIQKELL